MKAKVCHITTVHSPFDVRIFHKECKTLAKSGYEVYLIAQHDKEEIVDGIHLIPLPIVRSRIRRMIYLPIRALKEALKLKANIYHFHDPELIPIGVLLKVFAKGKVIYDVHEDVPKQIMSKYWIPKKLRGIISFIVNLGEKKFSFLLEVKGKEKKDDVFKIIYIGGLSKIRGISEVVKALEYVDSNKEVRLILCGKFSPIEYEKEVRNLKGFEKVDYLGWLEPDEVVNKLVDVDAGIVCLHPITNYVTALPVKLFEYMAAGLPVIASNFPLWREIVEGNNCGICVDPLNPKEIAEAIKYLIEHLDKAQKMGENGKKAVLEKYNWEKESEKLIKLYEDLLHG